MTNHKKYDKTKVVTKKKLWWHTNCDKKNTQIETRHTYLQNTSCDGTQIVTKHWLQKKSATKHKLWPKFMLWQNTNCY